MRLIEAAEKLFLRKGFEDASVDEISETAGYSRGAFYSNFKDKEQLFLAVIDRRRPKGLVEIFQQVSEPADQIAEAREWFSNQWRLKDFIALRMEFTRRAMSVPARSGRCQVFCRTRHAAGAPMCWLGLPAGVGRRLGNGSLP